jgi:hypothetical protein
MILRKLSVYCLLLLGMVACVTPPVQENQDEHFAAISDQLTALEKNLHVSIESACQQTQSDLRKRLESAEEQSRIARDRQQAAEKHCKAKPAKKSISLPDRIIMGEIEDIRLVDEQITIEARIDTGVETSSLGVYDLMKFERDGKDWVKFKLSDSKKAASFEYPVVDNVRIKLADQAEIIERFEIKMDIRVGDKGYRRQLFNLADRSHLEHQILIGRNFLRDIAIVDVARKHQLRKKK